MASFTVGSALHDKDEHGMGKIFTNTFHTCGKKKKGKVYPNLEPF